ncbi:unnamed protein product [Effrenium voratum]|uniref:Uncharacterized protein n=1 Tax=Effrenium voratum TaxID=2562239 RepID=A0AA36JR44_9DINO|nr:unnamed protein product [Effrenium voratum]
MVAEGPKTGVVESFYDFFAQLYSSSFTANQPWPSSFLGSSALEGPVPRGDDRGLENQPPWEAPNRKAERGQSPQPRGSLVPGNERCPKPHPLEYGWPEDEFHTPMKPPKVTSPSPHGFPDPMEPSARGREPQAARELQAAREPREPRESQHDREREAKEWMRQRERECQESEMKFKEAPRSRREEASQEPRRKERKERRERKEGEEPYKAEPEDLIDQHVAYFLRKNPQVRPRHKIQRRSPGVYLLDSRDVQIEWQYATEPGGQGFLVVVDGPLRQPFSDYMMDTEENATYDGQDIVQSNLHLIARDRRISFNDTHKVYNRLEAMKVAKEQALVREKAASYVKDGRDVPQDLMARYKKPPDDKGEAA